jgi:hypothetical protein
MRRVKLYLFDKDSRKCVHLPVINWQKHLSCETIMKTSSPVKSLLKHPPYDKVVKHPFCDEVVKASSLG